MHTCHNMKIIRWASNKNRWLLKWPYYTRVKKRRSHNHWKSSAQSKNEHHGVFLSNGYKNWKKRSTLIAARHETVQLTEIYNTKAEATKHYYDTPLSQTSNLFEEMLKK